MDAEAYVVNVDGAIAATARRELAEEVGVEVGAVDIITSRTFEADDGALCQRGYAL